MIIRVCHNKLKDVLEHVEAWVNPVVSVTHEGGCSFLVTMTNPVSQEEIDAIGLEVVE